MSKGLLLSPRRVPRPAPPGVRPGLARDSDRPPDGWELLNPTPAQRVGVHLDRALLRLADSAARGTTRREFLKRTGQVGLLAGLAASDLLWSPTRAKAFHTSELCKGCPPCGPSVFCGSDDCRADGQCQLNTPNVRRQIYTTGTCSSSSAHNGWTENCCSDCSGQWHCIANCADCCTPDVTGSGTCSCTNPQRYKCICRACASNCP